MKKFLRNKLGGFLLGSAIMLTSLTANSTNYYVSNSGNDSNSGTSTSTPWKSLDKVNSFNFSPGDKIYFKKGDKWFGQLRPRSGNSSARITYGAYGSGSKPLLHQAVELNSTGNWVNEGSNIWTSASSGATGPEVLPNTNFDSNLNGWDLYYADGYYASMVRDESQYYEGPASLKLTDITSGSGSYNIQLMAGNGALSIEAGTVYELSFYAKSTVAFTPSEIVIIQNVSPYSYYGSFSVTPPQITTSWKKVIMLFTANTTANDASLRFILGSSIPNGASLNIDNVSLRSVESKPLNSDVGNIIFNNEQSCGVKVWSRSDLNQQGEYYYDGSSGTVKLYSTSNPASYYSDIKCALSEFIIDHSGVNYVIFENLALKYTGSHGIGGSGNAYNIYRNLEISYIGGGAPYGQNIRLGNGIEFWANAHDHLIEDCQVWEVYDAGLTNQSTSSCSQYNIIYRNNEIWNCEYSFEFFNTGSGSSTNNIQFINNTCKNAGSGWGHSQRPDLRGRHICIWQVPS
ncbi:MAG: carbohydrate binding domain-containing protein, partial [Prolixibacteraceae bacterium]|nr:carbohydrate binding domain-containing protein [Prolixibacteraceae bacterium]